MSDNNYNVTIESLRGMHGKDAERVFDEIADKGGFGASHGSYVGGLDVFGILAASNTAITDKDKARIAELAGVSRKEVENKIEDGRKAMAEGDKSKNHIIPPDQFEKVGGA